MSRRTFLLLAGGVILLALGVREWFVLTMTVPHPTQGDVAAYLRYAMHLVFDGTFSQAMPPAPTIPDAFRSPGYPALIALLYRDTGWYAVIYQAQALLGAATVACTIALAREWMPRGWALMAGGWMALQPHHIAATGAMLTEVLFGLCIVSGLLLTAVAYRRRSVWLAVDAGAVLGFGYLVNPVLAFLPLLMLPLFWRAGMARQGATLALVALLAVGGWAARNALQDTRGDERAAMNFVQGSWPAFHAAWKWPGLYADMNQKIGAETATMIADPTAGLRAVGGRMVVEPWRYARWYVVEKPFLLWDWDVRVGHGQHYTLEMRDTVLDRGPLLGTTVVQWALNKGLFALALGGIVLACFQRGPALMVALTVVYLTAVHVVLQAEPRYSIPYRPLEIVLAFGMLAWVWRQVMVSPPISRAAIELP